jgi:hypothetical protein
VQLPERPPQRRGEGERLVERPRLPGGEGFSQRLAGDELLHHEGPAGGLVPTTVVDHDEARVRHRRGAPCPFEEALRGGRALARGYRLRQGEHFHHDHAVKLRVARTVSDRRRSVRELLLELVASESLGNRRPHAWMFARLGTIAR